MQYTETIEWMFSQLPMYQRQGEQAFKKDLTNSVALATHLNNPERSFKCIHVAGTNGKGSTSHMLASVLQEAGYKVGLYTSPHLKDFRERIKINGEMISEIEVTSFIESNKAFLEQQGLSFFEMTVGLALHSFRAHNVDIAIIEVGLGGRLDSTNIIQPEISVITNIGLDHTQFLGTTLKEIAMEKAGIIKPGVPVVIGEYHEETMPVFETTATKRNSKLYLASACVQDNYKTDLLGVYQQRNVKTAVQSLRILSLKGFSINEAHIKAGLNNVVNNTGLLGRWQILQKKPKIICDTGHNREGLNYIMEQLQNESTDGANLHIVMGVVNDKDLSSVLPMFPAHAKYYFCKPDIPRGLDACILCEAAEEFKLTGAVYKSVFEAFSAAKNAAKTEDLIFVGGSTFVVAEVL